MQMIRPEILSIQMRALHYSPVHNLLYVNNQKVACTTIKYSLWRDHDRRSDTRSFRGKTHDIAHSPFFVGQDVLVKAALGSLDRAQVFSMVRNPFTRLLSVYLHHVASGGPMVKLARFFGVARSRKIRNDFMGKVGLPPARSLSFLDFLSALEDVDLCSLTGHFRPQTYNLMWQALAYDFVGHMENWSALEVFLKGHNVPLIKRAPHAQNAKDVYLQYYTDQTLEKVRSLYKDDFTAFGYDSEQIDAPPVTIAPAATAKPINAYARR